MMDRTLASGAFSLVTWVQFGGRQLCYSLLGVWWKARNGDSHEKLHDLAFPSKNSFKS